MKRNFLTPIAVAVALAALPSARAASSSWNVNADGNWADGGSWLGSVIPGATSGTTNTDIATFGFTLTADRVVTVDANRNIGGITFSNTSASKFTLSGGGLLLSNGGVIQTAAGNGNHTDTISTPIAIQGESGSAAFTAGATSATSLLSIGAVTGVSTGSNSTTLTLNGTNTGTNAVTGIIGDGSGGGKLALVKSGTGTWVLTAANTYTGTTTVNAGSLSLDFSAASTATNIINNVANSSALALGGGTLRLVGKASTTNSQQFNGLTLNSGASAITLSANATSNPLLLTLGAITRNTGGTVNFTQPTGTISATNGITTSTTNTNGILGGWATVGGTNWATNNGTNIVALASYTNDTWASGNNTNVTGSSAPASGSTTNSLRFNVNAGTLTLSGTNIITSGGILFTNAGTALITGGTLEGASGKDLVVIQNNTSATPIIRSIIADNGGATAFTKSGAGTLTIGNGAGTGGNTYTGGTNVNEGVLYLEGNNSLGSGDVSVASGAAIGLGNYGIGNLNALTING